MRGAFRLLVCLADLRVNCRRCGSHAGGGASDKGGLLREDEDGRAGQRLRPSCAEVESGEGMLRGLRVLPGHSRENHPACLSAHAARNLLPLSPFASTSARIVLLFRRRAPDLLAALACPATAGRGKGNSTGGFYEIPIDDCWQPSRWSAQRAQLRVRLIAAAAVPAACQTQLLRQVSRG